MVDRPLVQTLANPVVFAGTSVFTASSPDAAKDIAADMGGRWVSNFNLVQPAVVDPVTGAAPYRVLIVDMYGQQIAEVQNATVRPIKWSVNDKGTFMFSVPTTDPKVRDIQVPEREVQVWRGGKMLWWGVITKARADESMVEFSCQTLEWYFDRRLVGLIPRTGVFRGVHLEYGTGAWKGNFLPGSEPKGLPVKALSKDQSIAGGNSMMLSASGGREERTRSADNWFTTTTGATLTAAAKNALDGFLADTFGDTPMVNVLVFHDNSKDWKTAKQITQARWDSIAAYIQSVKPMAKVNGQGMGEKNPVAPNSTAAGREENRRVKVSWRNSDAKKGHQQFVSQQYEIRVPTDQPHRLKAIFRAWVYIEEFEAAAANNWGVVIERQDPSKPHKNPKWAARGFKKVYARRFVPISKGTPRNRWVRMEASLMVPNDGKKYVLEGRLFPPTGVAYYDEADLFLDESLDYQNEEQANILRDLVDHAQDPDFGKTDLNIGRRIRNTGVKRTRRYYFSERTVIGDHMNEFTTLGDGMEWDIVTTPTERTLVSYYPRKERKTGYVLTLGQNIESFSVDVDGATTSNVVVVMANDVEAWAREERAVVDLSLIEGVAMEMAYMATPGSPIASLKAQAMRGIERYRKPTTVPQVTSNPAFTNEMLDNVRTGDVLLVDVRTGWFQTMTEYRVLDMTLDPNTEKITFTLMPEDTPIKVLSGWGQQWKYRTRAQTLSTPEQNAQPRETMKEWAARDYDDSGWAVGKAGFGWYVDGNDYSQQPTIDPATTIPVGHEVWMRKTVMCTEEMYVSARVDQFAYIYVNGHLVGDSHRIGQNFGHKFLSPPVRVDQAFLNPSGQQVVTVHVQDRLRDRPEKPSALYADVKVRGIFNPNHVGLDLA